MARQSDPINVEDYWTTIADRMSAMYGGKRVVVYGTTPRGDQIQRFGERRLGDPDLSREEAVFSARAEEPLVNFEDERSVLSVRLRGRQLAIAVFGDEAELVNNSQRFHPGDLSHRFLEFSTRHARRFDRAIAGVWAEEWADFVTSESEGRSHIELLLQQALKLLRMQWGYVAITSPGDPKWFRQIASAGVYPLLPEYLPADYGLFKLVNDGRLPAALEHTTTRWDRLNSKSLNQLLTRCDRTQVAAARDTLGRVRRCFCQPMFDGEEMIGVLVLHDPSTGRFHLDETGLYLLPHLVDRLQLEVRANHSRVKAEVTRLASEVSPADAVDMLPLNEALSALCQQLAEKAMVEVGETGYRAATLVYVPHENTLIMTGRDGPWSGENDTIKVSLADPRSVAARAFNARKSRLMTRGKKSAAYLPNIPHGEAEDPTRSTVAVPIRAKSNTLGVLVIDSKSPQGLQYSHLFQLERLVMRYAEPISRYHRVQHMDQLEGLIRDIGGKPVEQRHYDEFLRLVVEIGGARYGSLFVRRPASGKLERVARSPGQPSTGLAEYAFGEGITGALAWRRAVWRSDSLSPASIDAMRQQFVLHHFTPSWKADDALPTPDTESPALFVTMEADGEALGMVRLRKAPHERFSPIEEELAHQAANRFAEVIQRFFERTRTAELVRLAETIQNRFWTLDRERKSSDGGDGLHGVKQ